MTKPLTDHMKKALKTLENGPADIPYHTAQALLRRGLIEDAPLPDRFKGAQRRALIALGACYYRLKK
jgi:hypothetical protein